ncbi:GntR family transcriptional regulator [Micromonospora sp. NPDC049679]|uniref:GntR family transcriptional regulator n=1 Tax=Micromonospora sp. NPDC049679 TaxID=3155920 RepID=UPI0033DD12A3
MTWHVRLPPASTRPGSKLPPVRQLCGEFDVSRPVVRAAIDWLKAKGLRGRSARRGRVRAGPAQFVDTRSRRVMAGMSVTRLDHDGVSRSIRRISQ